MLPQVPASSPYFPVRLRCRYSRRLAILAFEQPGLGGGGTAKALHRRLAMGERRRHCIAGSQWGTAKALHRRLAMGERRRHCIAGSQWGNGEG
ncbi:hypothetical protein, partial [Anaerospora hongkongensis]|uniref:hypothetical protein n=1 Tax=Anaerospora hongkongensis TaxID=244830 RepID=UPI002FD9F4FD